MTAVVIFEFVSEPAIPLDTAPAALAVQVALYREMSPADKARRVRDLTLAAASYALAGLRLRHPGADERILLRHLAVLRLGPEVVTRAYGTSELPDGA